MRPSDRKTIVCVIGTRPEAIKMAPVIRSLRAARGLRCRVVCTGQHNDLVDPLLDYFEIKPDVRLNAMRPGQPLAELTERLVGSLGGTLAVLRPDLVLAQGDTASVLAAALASVAQRIPFGHVEAGLRTGNLRDPFPEEANRVIVSHLADIHFAPTLTARANLLREGIRPEAIQVTGNTVIDALLIAAGRDVPIGVPLDQTRRLILATAHRRETIGEPLQQICKAVRRLHDGLPDIEFLWPVHPNPGVAPAVRLLLSGLDRVHLCEPLAYGAFVSAMKRSTLILSDSGGIQEEATALGKSVLVLRARTERPEAVSAGAAMVVGHDSERITAEALQILSLPRDATQTGLLASPFGDGRASERIVAAISARMDFAQRARSAG
jgi:UDP-N-acetylglucosamine 2-epimerase (non-hydrolysing)